MTDETAETASPQEEAHQKALEFHKFASLPTELRRAIWLHSIQPREIFVYGVEDPDTHIDAEYGDWAGMVRGFRLVWAAKPPSLMHSCHEARAYSLPLYTNINCGSGRPTWINFEMDTICVNDLFLPLLTEETLPAKIKRLALEVAHDPETLRYVHGDYKSFVSYIKDDLINLEHLDVEYIGIEEEQEDDDDPILSYWRSDLQWEEEWDGWFEEFYHTCNPVRFYFTVTHSRATKTEELNPHNYVKRCRERRRAAQLKDADVSISDSEDGLDCEHRYFYWKHEGCTCVPQKQPASRSATLDDE